MKLIRRSDVVVYLEDKAYTCRYDYWPVSWNIKVREGWVDNGRTDKNGIELDLGSYVRENGQRTSRFNDKLFDNLWALYVENNNHLFHWMYEEWLGFAGDNAWYDFFDGIDDPALQAASDNGIKFYTTGRSSGHLVLDEFDGHPMMLRHRIDWAEWCYDDLWVLYKTCVEVDKLVKNRHESLACLYAFFRSEKEHEWTLITKLPTCIECEDPINFNIVDNTYIEDWFCQCPDPSLPKSDRFYCKNEDCQQQAANTIGFETGRAEPFCKLCTQAMLKCNCWGPIKEVTPLEVS